MEAQKNPTFYTHHRQPLYSAVGFNPNVHNHHHEEQEVQQDFINTDITTTEQFAKEHMFEKPLTPSDVGKLNRLVIPKQHAEKYFPLSGGADQQKGLVLSFEDESGKLWRFRYSYWNSSQSYVLTKGWSRYVKEKRLDAGDVVLFDRHMLDCERMFIGWRRRSAAVPVLERMGPVLAVAEPVGGGDGAQVSEWSTRVFYDAQSNYPSHHVPLSLPLPYEPDCLHAGEIYENVDTYQRGVVSTRRLRLFGVNLECPDNSEPSTLYGSSQSGQPDHQYNFTSNNLHHNMMRYHQHEG